MWLSSIIIAISALALGTVTGAAIEKRPPILGGFTLSTEEGCPMKFDMNTEHITLGYGQECGKCVPITFWNNATFKAIKDAILIPECHITIFNKPDCSDQGTASGPNCWTPEGGIAAYNVECPNLPTGWYPNKPCS
jgi:hypothetical protein